MSSFQFFLGDYVQQIKNGELTEEPILIRSQDPSAKKDYIKVEILDANRKVALTQSERQALLAQKKSKILLQLVIDAVTVAHVQEEIPVKLVWKVYSHSFQTDVEMFDPVSHSVKFDHRFKLRASAADADRRATQVSKMTTFHLVHAQTGEVLETF